MTVRQLHTFVLPHHRLCRLGSPRLPLRARSRARRPGQPAVLPRRSPTLPSSSSLAQPPPPSPRIVASSPSAALLPAAAAAVEPELLASPPSHSRLLGPLRHPRRLPLAACHSGEMSLTRSLLPLPLIPPSSVSLCSSPVLQLSTRPDDSQATSHLCEASSSPASEQESVAAASSQEQGADVAASSTTAACAEQPSVGHCPCSAISPSVVSTESDAAPVCSAAIVSPSPARASSRSAIHSQQPFSRWLRRAPASDASAQHFRRHYLQSSPMCACTLFPVYSSKVDLQLPSNPSARRFLQCLSTLCLQCILSLGELPKLPLRQYCTASMRR